MAKKSTPKPVGEKPVNAKKCFICGKKTKLVKTECCNQWICDDESSYVMFSYARNSCSRNHARYTLCGFHFNEGHEGDWKTCEKCKDDFETEMYVYYGTNEYNFEKLENPPQFEPTKCAKCGAVINLGQDGFSMSAEGYKCVKCLFS